ncbi:hypothetical protein OUZ56_018398 [Daphnia magna]|uniref:Uncharacterized protein n=1 Tax=Daphnia magna TaxID=35525 RepID=A0ABQ9Z8R4_9CRUS|nr:hypothetical protein OUZ56_018398 [Daphnia magna]
MATKKKENITVTQRKSRTRERYRRSGLKKPSRLEKQLENPVLKVSNQQKRTDPVIHTPEEPDSSEIEENLLPNKRNLREGRGVAESFSRGSPLEKKRKKGCITSELHSLNKRNAADDALTRKSGTKMEDLEIDVFYPLRKNGLNLASHMINILKKLGYNYLRTLAQVEDAEFLQAAVVESFVDCEEYSALPEEQKKALLGPKFWRNPTQFKFQLGEKAAISSLKPLCSELLAKMPLIFPSPNFNSTSSSTSSVCPKTTSLKVSKKSACLTTSNSANSRITGNQAASNFSTYANIPDKKGTVDISGKNIENHILDWCKKRDNIVYDSDDFYIKNSNQLYCRPCHHAYKFTLGVNGYWKATNFLQHISSKHIISNLVCNNKSNGPAVVDRTVGQPKKGKRSSGNVSENSEQVRSHENQKRSQTATRTEKGATSNAAFPLIRSYSDAGSSLSSDDSENEEYPVISSNEESTLEKEGSTQDEKTSEETSYEIKRSRLLKHNSWKGNKTLTQCSSSLSPNLKATMKATSIKPKKSRSDKRRSAMIRASAYDLCQSLISNHFKVVDDITALSKRNENLSARLKEMVVALKKQGRAHPFSVGQECEAETISLLKRIMRQAVSQYSKNKKGRRYNDTVLLDFSLSLWIVGGPQTYEILYDNMPGVFPSPTVIRGKLEKYNPSCVPGSIYLDTLLDIIKENNYPKKVLISEDATAIIPKREFHLRYNSILGGSLPLGESGLPDPDGDVVNSAMDIIQNFKLYPAATVQFVIMAQPLADSAPPIRTGIFASDNKTCLH